MRVIELNGDLAGQVRNRSAGSIQLADDVADRAGDQEVFLDQTQFFALREVV